METITINLTRKKLTYKADEVWFRQTIEHKLINRYTAEEFQLHYLSDDPASRYEIDTATFFTFELPIFFGHSEIIDVTLGNEPITNTREFFEFNP